MYAFPHYFFMGNPFLALVLRETNDKRVKNADYYNKRKNVLKNT